MPAGTSAPRARACLALYTTLLSQSLDMAHLARIARLTLEDADAST